MYRQKQKTNGVKILLMLIVVSLMAGYFYTKNSIDFEKELPKIHTSENRFWNKKSPIEFLLSDNKAIKYYKVELSDGKNTIKVVEEYVEHLKTNKEIISIKYPQNSTIDKKAQNIEIKITIKDTSFNNLFEGNTIEQRYKYSIDDIRPQINILTNSYMITQGGAALVVFQALDENLKELYIKNNQYKFKPQPYKKEGYYASLIAWPFKDSTFNPKIVAKDKAGNERKLSINIVKKPHQYKTSYIKAKDNFIDGKITDLIEQNPKYSNIADKLEKLKTVNETIRLENERLIHELSSTVSQDILKEWKIKKFYPLKNAQKVASHGDHRHYYYNDKNNEISQSYHVGYDLASTKMATIKTSNKGKVIYTGENGIYGNMPLIDHGFGLFTLYGHCSQILVKEGQDVIENQPIAKTGVSGLALGDHLHFGILVQGVEVRPVEWFDSEWIRKSIDNVFYEADKIIK